MFRSDGVESIKRITKVEFDKKTEKLNNVSLSLLNNLSNIYIFPNIKIQGSGITTQFRTRNKRLIKFKLKNDSNMYYLIGMTSSNSAKWEDNNDESQTLDLSFKIEKKTGEEFQNYLEQNNLNESNPQETFNIGKNDIKIKTNNKEIFISIANSKITPTQYFIFNSNNTSSNKELTEENFAAAIATTLGKMTEDSIKEENKKEKRVQESTEAQSGQKQVVVGGAKKRSRRRSKRSYKKQHKRRPTRNKRRRRRRTRRSR